MCVRKVLRARESAKYVFVWDATKRYTDVGQVRFLIDIVMSYDCFRLTTKRRFRREEKKLFGTRTCVRTSETHVVLLDRINLTADAVVFTSSRVTPFSDTIWVLKKKRSNFAQWVILRSSDKIMLMGALYFKETIYHFFSQTILGSKASVEKRGFLKFYFQLKSGQIFFETFAKYVIIWHWFIVKISSF